MTRFALGTALLALGAAASADDLTPAQRDRLAQKFRELRFRTPDHPLFSQLQRNAGMMQQVAPYLRGDGIGGGDSKAINYMIDRLFPELATQPPPDGNRPGGTTATAPGFSPSMAPRSPTTSPPTTLPKAIQPAAVPPAGAEPATEARAPAPALPPPPADARPAPPVTEMAPPLTEEGIEQAKRFETTLRSLEQVLGPVAKSPAIQSLLADAFRRSGEGGSSAGDDFAKWLQQAGGDGTLAGLAPDGKLDPKAFEKWDLPKLDLPWKDWTLPKLGNWSLSGPTSFRPPSVGGGFGGGVGRPSFGSGGATPPMELLLLLAAAVALWLFRGRLGSLGLNLGLFADPGAGGAAEGAIPDWDAVRTRADLVAAFEAAILRRLGTPARHWHHRRIAAALEGAGVAPALAGPLSQTYALARYAPTSERLPEAVFAAARAQLRELAGVGS